MLLATTLRGKPAIARRLAGPLPDLSHDAAGG